MVLVFRFVLIYITTFLLGWPQSTLCVLVSRDVSAQVVNDYRDLNRQLVFPVSRAEVAPVVSFEAVDGVQHT